MTYAQRLRKLANSTGLDAFGDEIRAIADEMDACGSAGAQSDAQAGLTLTGATQAEVTDDLLHDIADDFKSQYKHGGQTFEDFAYIPFARAILALRPERVPMTDAEIDAVQQSWIRQQYGLGSQKGPRGFARAIEAHHGITAQAKKEAQNG